ncbi:hypothetical protein GCK32_001655 [Trichostrongylus colubriformis]|uniref:Uncharacterized protein n=1 Tax=Trichostrongylus colubriformis TaxID=6319 RepID=A0AAN8GCU2_TRICO
MPRLKLRITILIFCLLLCSIATAANATGTTQKASDTFSSLNEIASLRKDNTNLKDQVDTLSSRIRSVEGLRDTISALSLIPLLRNANSKGALDKESEFFGTSSLSPETGTAATPKPVTTTSTTVNPAADFFKVMRWLSAFADMTHATPSSFPNMRWLGALGSAPGSELPTTPSQTGFPNMRWLSAFGGPGGVEPSRTTQKPQETVEYPVIVLPESSFYHTAPKAYPAYPPSGYDQYPVPPPPPPHATYARPP